MMCNGQLALYARSRELLERHGIRVAAISVDEPARSRALVERLRIGFPPLSDPTGAVIRRCGVWDDDEGRIAKPATLLVGPERRLRYASVGGHPADRPTVGELVSSLAQER